MLEYGCSSARKALNDMDRKISYADSKSLLDEFVSVIIVPEIYKFNVVKCYV